MERNRRFRLTFRKKQAVVIAITMCLATFLSLFLIRKSGLVKGADKEVDDSVISDNHDIERNKLKEGILSDRNGFQITAKQEESRLATCLYPEAYNIIGVSSSIYNKSGLRLLWENELFNEDDIEIRLTTDNNLQRLCYDMLEGRKGSIVVMDNQTGDILAMANRPDKQISYNVNTVDDKWNQYQKDGFLLNHALAEDAPGSTFKIITGDSLLENGLGDYTFEDTGDYHGIPNAGNAVYGNLDLRTAMKYSSNTYFASAGDQLGGKKLETTAKEFLIGTGVIQTDFGMIESNFDLEYYQDDYLIRSAAYGQGKTLISPVQMCMIISTVETGRMLLPHIMKSKTINDETFMNPEGTILKDEFDCEALHSLKEILQETADHYGFDDEICGGRVVAKTGTAEHNNGLNHIYMVAANERFSVVISVEETEEMSYELVHEAQQIFEYTKKTF